MYSLHKLAHTHLTIHSLQYLRSDTAARNYLKLAALVPPSYLHKISPTLTQSHII